MRTFIIGYLLITLVVIVHTLAYFMYDLSFRGYWTDKILVWSWLVMTIVLISIFFKKKVTKIYLGVLIFLTVLSFIPMALPVMAFYGFVSAQDREFTYRLDPDFRVQLIWKSPLAPVWVELVKETFLIEKVVVRFHNEFEVKDQYYSISEVESITLRKDPDDSISMHFSFPRGEVMERLGE